MMSLVTVLAPQKHGAFSGPGWGAGVGIGSNQGRDEKKYQILQTKSAAKISQLSWKMPFQ